MQWQPDNSKTLSHASWEGKPYLKSLSPPGSLDPSSISSFLGDGSLGGSFSSIKSKEKHFSGSEDGTYFSLSSSTSGAQNIYLSCIDC